MMPAKNESHCVKISMMKSALLFEREQTAHNLAMMHNNSTQC